MSDHQEVMVVSYLDIYTLAYRDYNVTQVSEVALNSGDSELMGLAPLSSNTINDYLEELGMDMGRAIEVRVGLHRPKILALGSSNESTPVIYGKSFQGFLKREVNKWQ